ncbi:MAG: folylpolyglutamate synthase/dihydrofolate synthase family protein [Bacteroidales bacterium]|nr:folylpolyglutamate synthase/dihydrofolate synthase family protein [Bacteroidales bacterium]
MNYNETINYLFNQLPAFERQGGAGYKPGLQTSLDLDRMAGCPHRAYRCIHVAGTNGKGSTSHLIASILQEQGYKVGLYTSPHIVDFRERIRVNGEMISEEAVVDFTARHLQSGYEGHPTFFELTSTMALEYFKQQEVDFAVIEVGLGGRLDSTNIITPILSVITNISPDHTQFLGNTPEEIAAEKAGIIKEGIPVVIGEAEGGVRDTFRQKAQEANAPIIFAQDAPIVTSGRSEGGQCLIETEAYGTLVNALGGAYQIKNSNTVLAAIEALKQQGTAISSDSVKAGFARIIENTGLIGRWQTIGEQPRIVVDSGHNVGAFAQITEQLKQERYERLHMVMGFMADKDVDHVLAMLPKDATYYFTQATTPRAMTATELQAKAAAHGLQGEAYPTLATAKAAAMGAASDADLIYIGGSMYLLAEALK